MKIRVQFRNLRPLRKIHIFTKKIILKILIEKEREIFPIQRYKNVFINFFIIESCLSNNFFYLNDQYQY